MIKDYDFIKIMNTYRAFFWNESKGSSYCETSGRNYWLLVCLISHFYTPYRKKQVVRYEKVEEFIYNRLLKAGYNNAFMSHYAEGFDSDAVWEFRDFLRVLKLLSETDSEELEGFIFLQREENTYSFEKVTIPENGGELIRHRIYFDIMLTTAEDVDARGNMDIDYRATFVRTVNGETIECENPTFYSE